MKLYCTKCYVRLEGRFFHPGEVFEATTSAELQRLLRLGAVAECEVPTAPAPIASISEAPIDASTDAPAQEEESAVASISDVDVMDAVSGAKKGSGKGGKK